MPTPTASLPASQHRARLAVARAALIGVCAVAGVGRSHALDIWIVTDSRHPIVAPARVRVTELDAVRRIEARLAQRLPANPEQAAVIATHRLTELTVEEKRELAAAYQGIVDAWSAGITKIPAVIVERRYIVYGERDIARALAEIERYRRTHR